MATLQASPGELRRRKPRIKARPVPVLIGAALLAGVAWWTWDKTHKTDGLSDKLITAKVTKGDLVESVSATGSVGVCSVSSVVTRGRTAASEYPPTPPAISSMTAIVPRRSPRPG